MGIFHKRQATHISVLVDDKGVVFPNHSMCDRLHLFPLFLLLLLLCRWQWLNHPCEASIAAMHIHMLVGLKYQLGTTACITTITGAQHKCCRRVKLHCRSVFHHMPAEAMP